MKSLIVFAAAAAILIPGIVSAECMIVPFVDSDGDNLIVWNPATAKSKCFVLGSEKWEPWADEMQLPAGLPGK